MKRPNMKQRATAMTASTVVLAIACALLTMATAGMFSFHYTATADLRVAYFYDAHHYTDLVSHYTRHFETSGNWPAPGTYSEDGFEYQSTGTNPNGEREDVYYTDYDSGMEVHFELYKDGTIYVWPFPD